MEFLKKLLPLSFNCKGEVSTLVKTIIVYAVAGLIGGAIVALANLSNLPLLGILFGLIGGLIDLYITGGIVVAILVHVKVIKE